MVTSLHPQGSILLRLHRINGTQDERRQSDTRADFAQTQSATVPVPPVTSAVRGWQTHSPFALGVNLLCDLDGVINFEAEVTNGALDLWTSE
jgi:hypothetical protein